jgi:hypothetical protein
MLLADPQRIEDAEDEATQDGSHASANASTGRNGSHAKVGGDEPQASAGPICSNCKEPMPGKKMSVCPKCGYYAALGICIDLDHQWEQLANAQTESPASGEAAAKNQPQSHLQIWINLVPEWGWMLLGCNVAILVVSGLARLALPSGSIRTMWSVTQLFLGISALVTCHIIVYLAAISNDASLSMLDIVLKPVKLWKETLRALPKTLRITTASTGGLSAVVGSMLIIGGLPYAVLLDWGFKQPPKQDLMGAIMARAQEVGVEDDGNLEDAMNDFVDKAGVDGEGEKDQGPKLRADCLVIGYTTAGENSDRITSLVLARERFRKLIYVGTVRGSFDEELHQQLPEFRKISRQTPFVFIPIAIDAQWVQPYYTCRVKYTKEDMATGKLERIQYDTILGKISF